MPDLPASLDLAASWIHDADALLITAGAGIGIDSGLPDFRGPQGFWGAYPGLRQPGLGFEDIANQQAFERDPRQAWGFYGHRLQLYRSTRPHEGFGILRELGRRMPHGVFVFTSNVDGQFEQAGFDAARMVECHGSIHHLQCLAACSTAIWSADDFHPVVDEKNCRLLSDLPVCPQCGGLARPTILMFDDWTWLPERTELQQRRMAHWLQMMARLVVIEIGAGTAIPSARRKGESQHARLIRINLREAEVRGPQEIGIALGALDALQALQSRVVART
ncbi:SIR2 family NAD-dependent protein deacylase [Actimicrobium antarcticum]